MKKKYMKIWVSCGTRCHQPSGETCQTGTPLESQLVVPHHGAAHRRRSSSLSIAPRRNTTEHSGSSPRSANSDSSSSLIGKNIDATSASSPVSSVLSRTADDVVAVPSISPNQPNSSAVVIIDSSPRSANFSSSSCSARFATGSGSGSGAVTGLMVADLWWW